MKKEGFEKFLSEKTLAKKSKQAIDWGDKKTKWISSLKKLYELFEESLKQYTDNKKISLNYRDITLTEEFIGEYQVKTMIINIGNEEIKLRPIGTNLLGVEGRVDMIGQSATAWIVLVDSRMKGTRDNIKVTFGDVVGRDKQEKENLNETINLVWKFVTSPPTREYIPVNEDTILDTIVELSNG